MSYKTDQIPTADTRLCVLDTSIYLTEIAWRLQNGYDVDGIKEEIADIVSVKPARVKTANGFGKISEYKGLTLKVMIPGVSKKKTLTSSRITEIKCLLKNYGITDPEELEGKITVYCLDSKLIAVSAFKPE